MSALYHPYDPARRLHLAIGRPRPMPRHPRSAWPQAAPCRGAAQSNNKGTTKMSKLTMTCVEWKPLTKNTLRGSLYGRFQRTGGAEVYPRNHRA